MCAALRGADDETARERETLWHEALRLTPHWDAPLEVTGNDEDGWWITADIAPELT